MEFDKDGKPSKEEVKFQSMTRTEFFEELARVHNHMPDMPIVSLVTGFYGNLCPQSLLTFEAADIMSLENAVSKYHQLPFPGSYLEQPQAVIEAFEVVRGAIIGFESDKIKNIGKENTSVGKSATKKR